MEPRLDHRRKEQRPELGCAALSRPKLRLPDVLRLVARATVSQFLICLAALIVTTACVPPRGTVGARFRRDLDGHLFVRDAPMGLGAARAGLQDGDEVILVEGRDVRTFTDEELHTLLSGDRGTRVRFTVLRGEEVHRVAVERTAPPSPAAAAQPPVAK